MEKGKEVKEKKGEERQEGRLGGRKEGRMERDLSNIPNAFNLSRTLLLFLAELFLNFGTMIIFADSKPLSYLRLI